MCAGVGDCEGESGEADEMVTFGVEDVRGFALISPSSEDV